MPPVHAAEVAIVAAALLIFWVIPTAISLAADRKRSRLVASPSTGELPATETSTDIGLPSASVTAGEDVGLAVPQASAPVTAEAGVEQSEAEAAASSSSPVAEEPAVAEVLEEPLHRFQLDDLRRVRALEVPSPGVVGDRVREQEWEEGLQLAETHARAIGATTLAASFRPQARSFHGVRTIAGRRELRFLLFDDLWPAAADQAVAEAVFEISEAGVAGARVVRRRTA